MDEVFCENRAAWRSWLENNHDKSDGVWLVFAKTKLKTVNAEEALLEALCFGWIDGQIKSIDESRYVKKFTPRRKGSKWSEKNKATAARLIEEGLMAESGHAAIERAQRDGTWDAPKPPPITTEQVEILAKALLGHEPAYGNFMKMSPSVQRTYTALYMDAKAEETRMGRLDTIIARLNENKKPM